MVLRSIWLNITYSNQTVFTIKLGLTLLLADVCPVATKNCVVPCSHTISSNFLFFSFLGWVGVCVQID